MVYTPDNQTQQSLSTRTARNLATTIKSPPQMRGISPRWLLRLLPWVEVSGGIYRVNRRDVRITEGVATNEDGEKAIDILSGYEGEPTLTQTFVDYDDDPPEYPLNVTQTIVRVHTRVSDLYSNDRDQLKEQLRLTIAALRERQEWEIINNDGNGDRDRAFGLLHVAEPSMRLSTRTGAPTPDDFDELLTKVWKHPAFFVAHPKAIAAFSRECTRRGIPPATVNFFGSPFITWRGVPMIASNKLAVTEGKTNILLMRVGEAYQGVVGLRKTGVTGEQPDNPGISVRLMGIDQKAIASYLVTLYFSAAVLVPDALGVLENVEVGHYYDEDTNRRQRSTTNTNTASPSESSASTQSTESSSQSTGQTTQNASDSPIDETSEFTTTATGEVTISQLVSKGKVKRSQADEYIEISNLGNNPVNLSGWQITSAGGLDQVFTFPEGTILAAGNSFRVYTNQVHPETGGFSFESKRAIWNDAGDEAQLLDATGNNVSTLAYGRNTIAGVKDQLNVPNLNVIASYRAINEQMSLPGNVTFTQALHLALESFLNDDDDIESPLGLIRNDPGAFGLPNNATKAKAKKKLRAYINDGATLTLYPTARRSTPEKGESVEENWIFELRIHQLSDHLHWAIVPRSGEKNVYNYGFS